LTFYFSMKTVLTITFLFFLFGANYLFAQKSQFDLNRTLKSGKLSEIEEKVAAFVDENKGTPLALYLEALTEVNAQQAVDKYIELLTKFPSSLQAEEATFRVGQYYFSRGLYIAARKYFQGLIEKYPQTEYEDDSMYFAAICLMAARKYESVNAELQNFLTKHPRSPFAKLAKEDLKEIKSSAKSKISRIKPQDLKGRLTLQIGAFSQINNALNFRNDFSKLGISTEIRGKKRNGVTIYTVTVGSFDTRESAERFGIKFQKQYNKPYRVVTKN